MYIPPYVRKHLYNVSNVDAYILSLDNSRIVAVDKYKKSISGPSKEHDKVIRDAINHVLDINPNGRIYIGPGNYNVYSDLLLQKNSSKITIEGVVYPDNEWHPSGSNIILNGARIIDDGANWGFVNLKNMTITVTGEYYDTPIKLEKTVVNLDGVVIRAIHVAKVNERQLLSVGSFGPPGIASIFRNVTILDSRRYGTYQYGFLLYAWYEGLVWDGGSIIINLGEEIGWTRFARIAGNIWFKMSNVNLYHGSINNNKYEVFFILDIPSYLERIEVPYNEYIAKYHIATTKTYDIPVYIDHIRFGEAGDLTIPSYGDYIKLIPGPSYQSNGVSTITGDGSTTQFTINVKHGLLKDSIVASATVGKSSAIPSKIVTYLKDTDGDGFYETLSIEVDFNTAPASGEEIPIYWRAFIVP